MSFSTSISCLSPLLRRTYFYKRNPKCAAWHGRKITLIPLQPNPFLLHKYFPPYHTTQTPNSLRRISTNRDDLETIKMKLANHFTDNLGEPKAALRMLLFSIVEEHAKEVGPIDKSFREKLWQSVSEKRIEILRDSITEKYANAILSNFRDPVLEKMYEQLQENNEVPYKWEEIWHYERSNMSPIVDALIAKAETMRSDIEKEVEKLINLNFKKI